jgi:hypothetical protein
MNAAVLRDRLERVREAGRKLRRRPAGDTLDSLCRVLDSWRDPRSQWRQELEAELPAAGGFSRETVRRGLSLALEEWSGAALRELAAAELGSLEAGREAARGFETTGLILAGAIPMPSLLSLVAPLVLRSPVLVKCASRDVVTAPLVTASIAEIDPELGDCIEIVSFPAADAERMGVLCQADCVFATGSDETIAAIRPLVKPPRRLVAHGHRLSVAALGAEALAGAALHEAANALALDVALWDQQGCLSPIVIFAAGERGADAVSDALADALADQEQRMPRGAIAPESAAAIQHERSDAELRSADGGSVRLLTSPGTAWTVVRESTATPRAAPLHRFVRVVPVAGVAGLLDALSPYARHLAGVAVAGFGAETASLSAALADLGASRICPPGRLQAPPLGWRREGLPVLGSLARFTDDALES